MGDSEDSTGQKVGGMLYIRAPLQTAGENGDKVIGCSRYHSHHDLRTAPTLEYGEKFSVGL